MEVKRMMQKSKNKWKERNWEWLTEHTDSIDTDYSS